MIKQLRNYFLLGSLFLTSLSIAKADDIFKGVRGPTKFQLDGRLTYSKNERNIESLTNNFILKYWDGEGADAGKFAFINLPYRLATFPNSNVGFGDITLGAGPRGKIQELNYVDSIACYSGTKKALKLYIDNGGIGLESELQPGIDEMIVALQNNGYVLGKDLFWSVDPNAIHSESAWAQRIWQPLVYFFGKN